ncbi:MAG TPA: polysaccharide biosynthesis protein [Vicinamibacterales bacterium]|nr:polysaccharide biosynthesis protein [Vicinamibacterales bacterium]
MTDRVRLAVHEALLGREQRDLLSDEDRLRFAGQRVLITGAGGSLGSELARQVAACRPARLTLFEQCEYNLFHVERELAAAWPDVPLDPVLGDVSRLRQLRSACQQARPHVVYHAAAYKHVTMVERAVCPAVETNVFGTLFTARAAAEVGARLVVVSSDKAAQPRSVMGATKRLAELVALAEADSIFRPLAVRFGNILGSSGSLVEILIARIQAGLPIQLTDPDATRYFMTAREAVGLILKADLIGRAGEIYWLDMGAPVRIGDLALRLLAIAGEAGLRPVPIEVIGLRPGEKLREDLTSQGLDLSRTTHGRIWVARQRAIDVGRVRRALRALRDDVRRHDPMSAITDLCAAVPDFVASREARQVAAMTAVHATPTHDADWRAAEIA